MSIEEIIISYLTGLNIAGIGGNVYAEAPEDEEVYVLVQRAGGSQANYIREHRIYTEVCVRRDDSKGQTKLKALNLHEAVVNAMLCLPDHTNVYGCHMNSDYEATNFATKQYRYQALWQITI